MMPSKTLSSREIPPDIRDDDNEDRVDISDFIESPSQKVLTNFKLTAIKERAGYFQHPSQGVFKIQDKALPAPKSSLNPPAYTKRISIQTPKANIANVPLNTQSFSQCISRCIAQEADFELMAGDFMRLQDFNGSKKQFFPNHLERLLKIQQCLLVTMTSLAGMTRINGT
jgi:hypothetical protein